MPQPIAKWNPARDVWETDQACLCGHSDVFSETFPTSGTTRAGTAYALPTPELHMGDSASSLLPTPTTDDAGNVTRDSGAFQSLTRVAQELSSQPLEPPMAPRADPINEARPVT